MDLLFEMDTSTSTTTGTSTTTTLAYYDPSYASVSFSFVLNLGLLILLVGTLLALLYWPQTRRFAAPRAAGPIGVEQMRECFSISGDNNWNFEPDAEVFLRFCILGLKFSLVGCVLDIFLLPMYYTGNGGAKEFNRFSLSNLEGTDGQIFGVIIAAYILTAVFARFLLTEWYHFLSLRTEHLNRMAKGSSSGGAQASQARRSVMVESIPRDYRDEDALRGFFEGFFGEGSVHSCAMVNDDSTASPPPGLPFSEALSPGSPILLQSPTHMSPAAMVQAVHVLQGLAIGRQASSTGFVTLRSISQCVQAQQVRFSQTGAWEIIEAPEPRDLLWQNVPLPLKQVRWRNKLAKAACVFGLLFWSVPVTLIQGWAQVGNLQSVFPVVAKLQNAPLVYSFLTDYLPVLALIGLQCCLPRLFRYMAEKYEGHKTKSKVQRIVFNRCIGYQIASLWVTMITGSIWIEFLEILDAPWSLVTLLGNSLPRVAVYFVTFVFTRTGFSLPLMLLRPWDLLRGPSTVVARCAFGAEAANAALVLVIGLSYSFIAPAILPACALYFAMATAVYRWLFAHVYEPEFDGRGALWYDLFISAMLSLLVGALALVALVYVAKPLQAVFVLPLPVGIAWFYRWCWVTFGEPSKWVTLPDAAAADTLGHQEDLQPDLYHKPSGACAGDRAASSTDCIRDQAASSTGVSLQEQEVLPG